jgi:pimeloyl-ACP methyl ester carboxylesterase
MSFVEATENTFRSGRHNTFYLAAGPKDGTPIIFLHGWPELSISWRHQLQLFGGLGFRAVAPDLRGHGRSSLYSSHDAYAQREIVADVIELLDSLGAEKAIWVGHDWGAAVVWNVATHHPDRCIAIATMCVPYATIERGFDALLPLINRELYPESVYPFGNWEYMRFYEEAFSKASDSMESNVEATIKALFRASNPDGRGKPSVMSQVRRNGGWFGGKGTAPDMPRDDRLLTERDLRAYVSAYVRTGFFGTNSLYMNHVANAAYAAESDNEGYIDLPVLFIEAEFDYTCDCVSSRLAEPMHHYCRELTVRRIPSGHWMAQEKPIEVNAHLASWLAANVNSSWPYS